MFDEEEQNFNIDAIIHENNFSRYPLVKPSGVNVPTHNKLRSNIPMSSRIKTKKQRLLMLKRRRELKFRRRERDNNENKTYTCHQPDCGKIFLDKNSYRKHIITHGEKQFICQAEGCGKRFLDNSKLKRHMLVHTGEKPYKCELCNKRFSLDFNLRTHLRIHTGEKPYVCSFEDCYKRFSQSSNLSAHEKTHFLPKIEEPKVVYYRGKKKIFKVIHANQVFEKPKPMIILDRQKYLDSIKTNEIKEEKKIILDKEMAADNFITKIGNNNSAEVTHINSEITNIPNKTLNKVEDIPIEVKQETEEEPNEEENKKNPEEEDEFFVPYYLTREYVIKHLL